MKFLRTILCISTLQSIPLYSNSNAANVEICFDVLPMNSDLIPIINLLNAAPAHEEDDFFNQMQPANFDNIAYAEENVAQRIRQIFTNHYFEDRVISCPEKQHWRIWAAPFSEEVRQYGRGQLFGYKQNFEGITAAIDYRKRELWIFSAGFSYTDTRVKVAHTPTKANFNTYAGTLGTAWSNRSYFADLQISFLYSPVHAKRKMEFELDDDPSFGEVTSKAKHYDRLNQTMGHFGCGFDFKVKAGTKATVNIYPFGDVDYIYLMQSGYKEEGAKSLNLKVHHKHYDYLRADGGLGIGYRRCFKHCDIMLDVSAGYVLEFRLLGKETRARFKKEDDCHFTVKGLNPENNLIAPEARLRFGLYGLSLAVGYHGEFGEHFRENAAEGELRVAF